MTRLPLHLFTQRSNGQTVKRSNDFTIAPSNHRTINLFQEAAS
jgi:hypothetical protein